MIRKFNTCYIWKEKKDEIRSEPIWTRNSISKCTNSPKSTAKAKAKSIYTNEIVANFHLNCIIIAPPLVSICNFSCVCVDCPYGHFLLLFVNFVPNFWLVQRKFHIIIGVDAIAAAINVNDKTLEVRKYDGKRKQRRWPIYWFHRVACRIWKKVYVHRTSCIVHRKHCNTQWNECLIFSSSKLGNHLLIQPSSMAAFFSFLLFVFLWI